MKAFGTTYRCEISVTHGSLSDIKQHAAGSEHKKNCRCPTTFEAIITSLLQQSLLNIACRPYILFADDWRVQGFEKLPVVTVDGCVVIVLTVETVGVVKGVVVTVLSVVTGAVDAVVVRGTVGVVSDLLVTDVGLVMDSKTQSD